MSAALHKRAQEYRQRLALRAWEYRQRNLARGVWVRLADLLADAERAYVISDEDGDALVVEGTPPTDIGMALEPPKRIFVTSASRIARLASHRQIAVRLSAELLAAQCLALVPFPGAGIG